ncbi:hypothetical protein BGY98DRAFT_946211 [Russula aff. rugulosa BPL654]|nr:hypothetical protein BGY98DRAFT_946211 [Russula aff. rugulosa BPL654]
MLMRMTTPVIFGLLPTCGVAPPPTSPTCRVFAGCCLSFCPSTVASLRPVKLVKTPRSCVDGGNRTVTADCTHTIHTQSVSQ